MRVANEYAAYLYPPSQRTKQTEINLRHSFCLRKNKTICSWEVINLGQHKAASQLVLTYIPMGLINVKTVKWL